jgi:DHA2 family multidrug resistance protein
MFGLAYALPIYLQLGLGQTATAAGAWLVIPGVALVAAIHVGGPLSDRASFRPVLLSGFGLLAIGLGGLGLPTPFGTLVTVIALATVARAGMGLVFCGINAGATRTVPDRLLSKVPGSINFFRLLGGAVGVRALAALLEPTAGQGSFGTGVDRDFVGGFFFLATLALLAIPIAVGIQRIPAEHANASLHERNQP